MNDKKHRLIDDPICDIEEWGYTYMDCEDCPAFYDCMEEDE